MSAEESPAQQAARLRRERREAKIKEGGTARLDKITSMSGRTPANGMNYIMTGVVFAFYCDMVLIHRRYSS